MARHNAYVKPREKKSKEPFFMEEDRRIKKVILLIRTNKKLSDYNLYRMMELGHSAYDTLMRMMRQNFSDIISWNKVGRMWEYVGPIQEEEILEGVNI